MHSMPQAWQMLMDKLADMIIVYAKAQINAGAKPFRFLIHGSAR